MLDRTRVPRSRSTPPVRGSDARIGETTRKREGDEGGVVPFQPSCFIRMFLGGRRVLVPLLTVLVCGVGVRLGLFVLAYVMEMGGLMMMMGRGMMMGGRLMVMLAGRMLGLCHNLVPSYLSEEPYPGRSFDR